MKVSKLPSGNWTALAYAGGTRKRFSGSNKAAVRAAAAAWEEAHKDDHARGSFTAAAETMMKMKEGVLSPATLREYGHILARLQKRFPSFCRMECISITDLDVQEVIDGLSHDLAPKSVRDYFGFICAVFRSKRMHHPLVDLPAKKKAEIDVPNEWDVRRMLSAAWKKEDKQLWLCIALAVAGPLREGEIAALGRTDRKGLPAAAPDPDPLRNIDFSSGRIHVRHDMVLNPNREWQIKEPKTPSSNRVLEMPAAIMSVIRKQGYVTDYTPQRIYRLFTALCRDNGIRHYRFHSLRHYGASLLHAKGFPDAYIQMRTGHASSLILREVYTHVLDDEKKKAEEEIVEIFSGIISA